MVTDEILKRAVEAYAKDTGAEGFQLEGWIEPAIRAALEAALSAEAPPIRLPTALSLMIEKGVDPEQNGYCRVIDVEKLLCAKLGKEWSATGMSIVSLVDEMSALSAQVQGVAGVTTVDYMRRHDAAIAAYEANTPNDYRYSALALRKAVDAAFAVAAAPAKQEGGTNE